MPPLEPSSQSPLRKAVVEVMSPVVQAIGIGFRIVTGMIWSNRKDLEEVYRQHLREVNIRTSQDRRMMRKIFILQRTVERQNILLWICLALILLMWIFTAANHLRFVP